MTYLLALALGIIAGLRSMTAPAAVSWAAHLGILNLEGSWLAFLGHPITPWVLTALALGELVVDKLPKTPSRTMVGPFAGRLLTGGISGAAIGVAAGSWIGGLVAGLVGAVVGTFGGYTFRARLAAAFHKDLPAALVEDLIAVGGAVLVVLIV